MLRGEEWGYINDDNDVCQISWKLHFCIKYICFKYVYIVV